MKSILKHVETYQLPKDLGDKKPTQVFSSVEEAVSLASLYNQNKQQIIIVKDNLYHAERLYDQLSHLSDDVYIYMSEESKRIESIASSPEFRATRLAVLSMLLNDETGIIVTHTAALLRYLPNVETFKDRLIACAYASCWATRIAV